MAGPADYAQFIYGGLSSVGDPVFAGLAEREKSRVLGGLPKGPDGKLDYNQAIDYLLRNNQLDAAKAISPIIQAQAQQGGVFGTPIYGRGPNGESLIGTFNKNGQFVPINTPGFTPTPGLMAVPGTEGTHIIDRRSGQPAGGVPGQPTAWPPQQQTGTPVAPHETITPQQAVRENPQMGQPQVPTPMPRPPQAGPAMTPAATIADRFPPPAGVPVSGPAPGVPGAPVPPASPSFIPKSSQTRETMEGRGQAIAKAQAAMPGILSSVGTSMRLINEAIKHPGRETATGLSGTLDPRNYISGTDAKNYQIRHKQLEGRVFLDAFDQLRGGGAITEAEGNKATIAHGRLALAQSDEEYKAALQDLQKMLTKGLRVARLKAQGRLEDAEREIGLEAPDVEVTVPGSSPSIDDLVKKYLK